MTGRPDVPQFGALLRDHISSVPVEAQPAFLAGLERSAAERYRRWADELPEWRNELLACAEREAEIAAIVDARFPLTQAHRQLVDEALPAAVQLYSDVFEPHPVDDQVYIQSEAEIQGSQAWVRLAEGIDDAAVRADLARCTELELACSQAVRDLLTESAPA